MRVLVTGANRGIGYALVDRLLGSGSQVVMTSRDPAAGATAAAALRTGHPGGSLDLRVLDVSSPASIDRLAAELQAQGVVLDAVINNAGVLRPGAERELTLEGVEVTLATNALGPLRLSERLVPLLGPTGRILALTSRLHLPGSHGEEVGFSFDDPSLDHGYNPDRAYKNSKLALIWVCRELDRRLSPSARVDAICPGFVPTTAEQYAVGAPTRFLMRHVLPRLPFTVSVEQAAADVLWALDAPELSGGGGRYLADRKVADASADAIDPHLASRFWELAHRLWPPTQERSA